MRTRIPVRFRARPHQRQKTGSYRAYWSRMDALSDAAHTGGSSGREDIMRIAIIIIVTIVVSAAVAIGFEQHVRATATSAVTKNDADVNGTER